MPPGGVHPIAYGHVAKVACDFAVRHLSDLCTPGGRLLDFKLNRAGLTEVEGAKERLPRTGAEHEATVPSLSDSLFPCLRAKSPTGTPPLAQKRL
jgi:hypothetical protein